MVFSAESLLKCSVVTKDQTTHKLTNNTNLFQYEEKRLILLLANNTIEALQHYVAALCSKHALMLLPYDINVELLSDVIERYKPYWIVGKDEYIGYKKENSYLVKVEDERVKIHEDVALLLSTSGTTGSQKFVRLSTENLLSNASAIVEYLEINEHDRTVMNLPLSYSYGMSIINSHVFAGATILLTDESVLDKTFWEFVKNQKATSIAGVPFTYQMLYRIGLTKMELPHLKILTQAGGRLNEKLVRHFGEWAIANQKKFYVMYGQTEAAPRISFIPPEKVLEKAGSIGIAIPGGELSIVNDELVYKGPNVMMGYAECLDDLEKGNELNGTLHTGDTAEVDNEGYFTITGRLKRFVKVFGLRINLDDVEKKLESKLNISLACIGIDDKLIVAIEDKEYTEQAKNEIEQLYHLHKTAYKIVVVQIPHFANGKTDYMKLKELFL